MAKKANIIRIMQNEVTKGNIYIAGNGDMVSEDFVNKGIKDQYLKDLRDEKISYDVSFAQYKEQTVGSLLKVEDVIAEMERAYNLNYTPYSRGKAETEEPDTVSEQSTEEPKQEEPKAPTKKGVKKDA